MTRRLATTKLNIILYYSTQFVWPLAQVNEESQNLTATYSSFKNIVKTQAWSADETRKFYQHLRKCGSDFTTMAAFFETRTKKQLLAKFKKEVRDHPKLVEMAMNPVINTQITSEAVTNATKNANKENGGGGGNGVVVANSASGGGQIEDDDDDDDDDELFRDISGKGGGSSNSKEKERGDLSIPPPPPIPVKSKSAAIGGGGGGGERNQKGRLSQLPRPQQKQNRKRK